MNEAPRDWLAVLEALAQGDRTALLELSHVIHGFLARYSGRSLEDCWADISQEVIARLVRVAREGRIREPRAVIAYVGIVTRNEMVSFVRRRDKGRLELRPELSDADLAQAESQSASAHPWDRELLIDAGRALAELPEKAQAVLRSIYHDGRSYDETAEHLGLPLGTVNRTRNEGMRELRRRLGIES